MIVHLVALILALTLANDQHTTYLDLEMNVVNNEIVTSLYDKRDDFPFTVVNFPDLSGNIPQDSSYGVFIAQTLCYARACAMYNDFHVTHTQITCTTRESKFPAQESHPKTQEMDEHI